MKVLDFVADCEFQCTVCFESFVSLDSIGNHIDLVHPHNPTAGYIRTYPNDTYLEADDHDYDDENDYGY